MYLILNINVDNYDKFRKVFIFIFQKLEVKTFYDFSFMIKCFCAFIYRIRTFIFSSKEEFENLSYFFNYFKNEYVNHRYFGESFIHFCDFFSLKFIKKIFFKDDVVHVLSKNEKFENYFLNEFFAFLNTLLKF
jgi:hypothetical protein